jgi:hypothetical protein
MNRNQFYLYTYLASAGIYASFGVYYSLNSSILKTMASQEAFMFVLACGFFGLCLGLFGTWIYNTFYCKSYSTYCFLMSILTPSILLLLFVTVFGVIAIVILFIIIRKKK